MRNEAPTFYAYLHARPNTVDANGVFYVGKGTGDRWKDFHHRNKHHKNIVAKHGAGSLLIGTYECSCESVAMDLERGLIKRLRAMGVKLANVTDGGGGTSGYRHTDDAKFRMSYKQRDRVWSPEFRAKVIPRMKEAWTPDRKRKHAEINPFHKPESIAKRNAATSAFQKRSVCCPHCGKIGKGSAMLRYHFARCVKDLV